MSKQNILLPSGLYDLLPPDASKESDAVAKLLGVFAAYSYEQVSPPLVEFETSLLSGRGKSLAKQTFRMVDPLSQTMLGIRADITLQVARIASSRLSGEPRPLRLCYAGQILQSNAESLRSERQLTQAGIELIGTDSLIADSEVMIIAANALADLGIKDVSIDINLPALLWQLCPEATESNSLQAKIKQAITNKSTNMIAELPVKNKQIIADLVDAAGDIEKSLTVMRKHNLSQADEIAQVSKRVLQNASVNLSLDAIEYRGLDYHQGISFSIFAKGLRHELGRGGRYMVEGENATGFTIYVTHLLPLLPELPKKKQVLIADGTSIEKVKELQAQGFITAYDLSSPSLRDL